MNMRQFKLIEDAQKNTKKTLDGKIKDLDSRMRDTNKAIKEGINRMCFFWVIL